MAITLPLTSFAGGAQTGFTSPTYTAVADTAVDLNARQVAVTTIGGTQTGVDSHSVARPFTLAVTRPKQFGVLGKPNPTTGLIAAVPRNTYKFLVRKGVTVLAGQPSQVAIVRVEIEVPAGADIADPANVRAAISATIGLLTSVSAGVGDTTVTGIL